MNIWTLNLLIAAIAIGTAVISAFIRRPDNWLTHYIRNFLGVFFIFSGMVKAIDPIGTKIKMEDYFSVFTEHFSALTGFWDALYGIALPFGTFLIIVEILLGLALLIGLWKNLTLFGWFAMLVFFLFLTGFTFMTGYVPPDATFFEFSKWGSFNENWMRVTDCGCFGDFVKLKPFESFMKDVFLLILLLVLVLWKHTIKPLFKSRLGIYLLGIATITLILFSLRNINNLPLVDFRAYAAGTDLRKCTSMEGRDPGKKLIYYNMVHQETGENQEIEKDVYMADRWWEKTEWKIEGDPREKVIREAELPPCKDFLLADVEGNEVQDDFLAYTGITFLVNSYDADKSDPEGWARMSKLMKEAENPYIRRLGVTGSDIVTVNGLIDNQASFMNLDATPIKTMNRANPGLTIIKDGVIISKHHHNHLPSMDKLKKTLNL